MKFKLLYIALTCLSANRAWAADMSYEEYQKQIPKSPVAQHAPGCKKPMEDADVAFRAKAISTNGTDTIMDVLETIKS